MKQIALSILILIALALPARAAPHVDDLGGRIRADTGDGSFDLPMLDSAYSVTIEGDMATVEVVQRFANPAQIPVEAEYLFPLNQKAAIYAMEMQVADETITAIIREKAKAEAAFAEAAEAGKSAALLTQHRPNMFTQRIANLMPGLPVTVKLRYVQMVPKIDGAYELVVPMIVGPRYDGEAPQEAQGFASAGAQTAKAEARAAQGAMGVQGAQGTLGAQAEQGANSAQAAQAEQGAAPARSTPPHTAQTGKDAAAKPPLPANTWSISDLPAYPQVAGLQVPDTILSDRVALDLSLTGGVSLSHVASDTHPLALSQTDMGYRATFAAGKVMDNRDFVLRYRLGGSGLEAASLAHSDARGGFVSVMIEPPAQVDTDRIAPREVVFVLDTSGSMGGAPMEASKIFMDAALKGLRRDDYFRIIPFSNTAQRFSNEAVAATAANKRRGRAYVDSLHAGGGTEIADAIRTAFATPTVPDTMRIVVFLSDGYIGNEAGVLQEIDRQIGKARIYAFGIGNAVNRYLLDAMAEEGRGYARYVGVDQDAREVARELAADLKTPLLTDIEIDWGDLEVTDVSPARLPDLFEGGSLRVYARHDGSRDAAEITVRGLVAGHRAQMPVKVQLTGNDEAAALPLIWARARIDTLDRNIAVGRDPQAADAEITKLGLAFSLQTRNTSFVAISQKVVNPDGAARKAQVPLPMVSGVGSGAYPSAFSGSSSPEPEALLGFAVVAALSALGLRRRRPRSAARAA